MTSSRERLLAAGYACIARYGIAKTTIDDVAREANLSRATVYRYFPGGRDELVRAVVSWEAQRFFVSLGEAVEGLPDLATRLEVGIAFAHRALEDHDVLQKILDTEPELLMPALTVESDRLLELIRRFLRPQLGGVELVPGLDVEQAADWLARLVLSYIHAQGVWNLDDPEEVRDLVRAHLLPGILRTVPSE